MRLCGNTTSAFSLFGPTHEYLVRKRDCYMCDLCDKGEAQERALTHEHIMRDSVCLERGASTGRHGTRSAVSVTN